MNTKQIDSRTKWSYCVGATGRDMAYTLVSLYLITYIQYTMKLTVAQFSVISGCVVLCLIWDAVNDPLMGIIIENCHFKAGKFKPWIFTGVLLNAVIIVLLFSLRPQGWAFVAFFGVSYLLWGMTYTMNDIAYWGMLPSLSSDPQTRNSLVTLMSIFICIGQFSVAGILPALVAGNAVRTYRYAALIVASCFIAFQMLTCFGVRERPVCTTSEKLSLRKMFGIFRRNDQLIVIGISALLFNIGNILLIIFAVNFFYFEFGYAEGGKLVFIFTVMYGLGTLVSQACFSTISRRFNRKTLIKVCISVITVCYTLLLLFGYATPKNSILLNTIGLIIFFFQGLWNLMVIVMLNNTIEYDEYKFHERHDSVIAAIRSFAVKLASAINQGISAVVLIISGIYTTSQKISQLEIEAGKGIISGSTVLTQADAYIRTVLPYQTLLLRIGMVLFPLLAFWGCYLLITAKYKIDEKEYIRIVGEIEKRRETEQHIR
jgi:sugar (glycoside-pentoside-hexuronide) transporter